MQSITHHTPNYYAQTQLNLNNIIEKPNIAKTFFKLLEIKPLTLLGMTSKSWKNITDAAPVWRNLCKHIKVEEKSKPAVFTCIENNNVKALDHFLKLCDEDSAYEYLTNLASLTTNLKNAAENWLKLLQANSFIQEKDPACTDVAAALLVELLTDPNATSVIIDQARCAAAKIILKENFINIAFFQNLKISNKQDNLEILQAQMLIAELHLEKQASILNDTQVSKLLQNLIDHRHRTKNTQFYATYLKAQLACEGRDSTMSLEIAFQILLKIKNAKNLSPIMQLKAKYHVALMQAKGLTLNPNYFGIAGALWEIICHNKTTKKIQAEAQFYLAKLALNNFTKILDKNAALQFMQIVPNIEYFSEEQRQDSYQIIKENTDFQKNIAHYSVGNEILILDPADSFIIKDHFQTVLKNITNYHSEEAILLHVLKYVKTEVFKSLFSDPNQELNQLISQKKFLNKEIIPVINLEELLALGIGFSRHYALVAAYILDGLTKQVASNSEKPYLLGTVQLFCETFSKSHPRDWVLYTYKTHKILIDPMTSNILDFSTPENIKLLELRYKPAFISYLANKLNMR